MDFRTVESRDEALYDLHRSREEIEIIRLTRSAGAEDAHVLNFAMWRLFHVDTI